MITHEELRDALLLCLHAGDRSVVLDTVRLILQYKLALPPRTTWDGVRWVEPPWKSST